MISRISSTGLKIRNFLLNASKTVITNEMKAVFQKVTIAANLMLFSVYTIPVSFWNILSNKVILQVITKPTIVKNIK